MLSAVPRATLTPLSCSPNFPRAHYLDIRTLTHELIIVKYSTRSFFYRDHDAPCLPLKNLNTHYLQFLLGRLLTQTNWKQCICKILGGKQGALWSGSYDSISAKKGDIGPLKTWFT